MTADDVDLIKKVFEDSLFTIRQRGDNYGSWEESNDALGGILAIMFPDGVVLQTPEDYWRWYNFTLIIAKLNRYAPTMFEGGHADSIHDAGNYTKLLEAMDIKMRKE